MSYIKADNPLEQKHFDYLEELRQQSGDTNMWGAAPYLYREYPEDFDVEEKRGLDQGYRNPKAAECLQRWMKLHDDPTRILEGPGL